MSALVAVVEGVVKDDGSLEISEKLTLPAGRVRVTVVSVPELPKNDPFWQHMQALRDAQRTRGHVPRGIQEVEEERQRTRQEWEDRMRRIEQIHTEARELRKARVQPA